MSMLNNSIFVSTPPALSLDEIHSVIQRHYGLKISSEIVLLGSERDQNAVICADGKKLVFRVTNCAESPDVTHLQTSALRYLQRTVPDFPIQHIVPTLDGRTEAILGNPLGSNVVRLMTYLDGTPCHQSSTDQRFTGKESVKCWGDMRSL